MYPYEMSCAVSWWYVALVSHVWQSWGSLEILSRSTSEGYRVRNSTVRYPVGVSMCATYVVGAQTAMASRMLSSDFEKTWRIIDFQTGGPTVSPHLLIYMCWKSNMISDGANRSILLAVRS